MQKVKNILILAGGDSSRFWPLKKKSYFPFLGRSLIGYLIKEISSYFENINIVINQHDKQKYFKLNHKNLRLIVQGADKFGMGGAIMSAQTKISGEVIVINAEDIFNYSVLKEYIDALDKAKYQFIFLGKKVSGYFSGGYIRFSKKEPAEIVEKPPKNKTPSDTIKLVADYFSNFEELVEVLTKTKTNVDDQYEQAINILLKKGIKTKVVIYDDYWYPLKYPWHVFPMMKFFLSQLREPAISSSAIISKQAKIIGHVSIGENVKIGDFSKIIGPCYIDDNVVIGDYSLIRQSYIGERCLVGGYCDVTRSYLGKNVMLHNNYVGDSILSDDVMLGSGAKTANFRFDGQTIRSKTKKEKVDTNLSKLGAILGSGSKIGVNVTLFPGVKIGSNTLIGPGEVVGEDVEDNMFVLKGKKRKNIL